MMTNDLKTKNSKNNNQSKLDVDNYLSWTEEYYLPLFNYLYGRLSIVEEIQKLTKQAFVDCIPLLSKTTFNEDFTFEMLLFQTANDNLIDYLENHTLDEEELERFECNEEQQYTQILLQTLSANQQNMIALKFFAEFTNNQISKIINIKSSNLKKLMHKALKEFQKTYVKFNPDVKNFSYEIEINE